ncbi:Phosphoacetylglucosamine mutase [Eumeta japonica]|uniref:phosphoacetylglucosamine mutase n=1 Tax=Eumeta variegata TaxID=151549 RepID=A0A4C1WZN6_EUMVA|nr:Phosphoacetylglucosamine mutase [Eumeta japonica]
MRLDVEPRGVLRYAEVQYLYVSYSKAVECRQTAYVLSTRSQERCIRKPPTSLFNTALLVLGLSRASLLDHVVYRMGLLAVLRSRVKNGRTVGLMITASHNLEPDNGVKLVDPDGEMLEQSWEDIATRMANVSDNDLQSTTEQIVKQVNADMMLKASVYIGMDTRYTSPRLAAAAVHGVMALKGTPKEFGIVTTPMLHFIVKCRNDNTYGTPTEEDGANGVGGKKLNIIKKSLDGELDLVIYNIGGNGGKLNLNCGADYVKVSQKPPVGVEHVPYQRVASFDGDGDRVVYYYLDDKNNMNLLDGDRIATLIAGYVMSLLQQCGASELRMGLVQTAYANGGSTKYITEKLQGNAQVTTLELWVSMGGGDRLLSDGPHACLPLINPITKNILSVKHLHHAALGYDIGVYFEANGHGTIIYSKKAKALIHNIASEGDAEQRKAAQLLLNLIDVTNEAVGDAISDLFLVETVLCARGWDVLQWQEAYQDLPCRQLKLTVEDRNVVTTTDAERVCTSPEGLQEKIDELCTKYENGRAFVRPSGTEDILRIYAEADTQKFSLFCMKLLNADKLATEVALAAYELAGGVGARPEVPA